MKILILLSYYNRPLLVKNSLRSILAAHNYHEDWHLVFGDDGSPIPGEPIVRDILRDFTHRITFVNSNMSFEDKIDKGLALGKYANQLIADSDADIGITLCDDDELCPTYLRDINDFFFKRPDVMYCYSKVHLFNPTKQTSENIDNVVGPYNRWADPINPVNKLDASQVAFRLDCCRVHGIRFPETTKGVSPWVENIDAKFFQDLFDKFGPAQPTDLVAQYKGIHDHQLVWHKKGGLEGLKHYIEEVTQLGGERF